MHDNCEIIILGDFNTTFSTHERINMSRSKSEITISKKISDMYNDLNLKDCWDINDLSMISQCLASTSESLSSIWERRCSIPTMRDPCIEVELLITK